MFKIALIQNLSEVRNYSYADLRKELNRMKFDVTNYTRENIDSLLAELNSSVDCVVFASNSLNDHRIYEYVCSEQFKEGFRQYLDNKGAALIMHQNSLKEQLDPFPFLGDQVEKLEKNYAGENVTLKKSSAFSDQYYVFPNRVEVGEITPNCFKNPAVSGNYWMLLREKHEEWLHILEDDFGNGVISKMHNKNVIFSSLLLDYQKHNEFLENILINLMVDNMSLAILENDMQETLGFSYFLNSLETKKLYYKKYNNNPEGIQSLLENIRLGIHGAILVTNKTMEHLSMDILSVIDQYGVKLIQIKEENVDKSDSFTVYSVDKSISLQFSKIELKIQEELERGFVGGSFMKTIEVLQKLKEFEKEGMTKGHYTRESIAHVLEKISPYISEDGSYDKTFGATCKVLWLFAEFLGKKDKLTLSSYNNIKNQKNLESIREKLERAYALADFERDPVEYLKINCSENIRKVIEDDFADITEYDFLTILKIALVIKDEDILIRLFDFIKLNVKDNGEFFNSYVTAAMLSYLIDMYQIISDTKHQEAIKELLFDSVIYLRGIDTHNKSIEEMLLLVCALYKFENVVSFPVSDLTELIFKTGTFPKEYHEFEKQINIYEKSRLEMDHMVLNSKNLEMENKKLRIYKKAFFASLVALVTITYLSVYLGLVLADTGEAVFESLFKKVIDSWPSLFSFLIIPIGSYVYDKHLKKGDDK